MTGNELIHRLNRLSEDERNRDVYFYNMDQDIFYPIDSVVIANSEGMEDPHSNVLFEPIIALSGV